jgi:trk system potassium uptake protein TrkA
MKLFILVAGGGKVGASLTRTLLKEGYEVALIEQDRRKYEDLEQELEHVAVFGDGTEISVLENAGIARADYVIAVTGDDEDNIIISQLASDKYSVGKIIARVNNPGNQATFDLLSVKPTVSAVNSILSLIEHRLPHHYLLSLLSFEEENVDVVEMTLSQDSAAVGKKVREMPFPAGILLALISRENEAIIPHGDAELRAEDHLIIILEKGKEPDLLDILGGGEEEAGT